MICCKKILSTKKEKQINGLPRVKEKLIIKITKTNFVIFIWFHCSFRWFVSDFPIIFVPLSYQNIIIWLWNEGGKKNKNSPKIIDHHKHIFRFMFLFFMILLLFQFYFCLVILVIYWPKIIWKTSNIFSFYFRLIVAYYCLS